MDPKEILMEGIEYLSSPEPDLPEEIPNVLNEIEIDSPNGSDPLNISDDAVPNPSLNFGSNIASKSETPNNYPKTLLSLINAANPDSVISEFHASDADPNPMTISGSVLPENTISSVQESNFSPKEFLPGSGKKKLKNASLWKKNIQKRLRQSGKEYTNIKGQSQRKRKVQMESSCNVSCSHNCCVNFSEEERKQIFNAFWSLTDNEKGQFYSKFVQRTEPKRKRTGKKESRKKFTFEYFFEKATNQKIDVCQKFFLSTIDISQRRIYYFFATKYNIAGTHSRPSQGNFIKKITPDSDVTLVKEHIKSFPVMESHYCRSTTKKQYLEAGLSLTRMYKMYVEKVKHPVSCHIYRKIFNELFNLSFFKPKKDICDKCAKFKANKNPKASESQEYDLHRNHHNEAKTERDIDRKNALQDTVVIAYDLQNVFSLPKANISNYFYRRKYAVYNLTGYCQNNKVTYCAMWHETLCGRSGNDIASGLNVILENVLKDFPKTKHIILWSDACVPQNKNRMISLALLKLIEIHNNIETVTHKYSEPGHSQVQEVDAVHSAVEKYLKDLEVYSPVSLIRILNGMNYNNVKLKIAQLKKGDILNFNKASLDLKMVPYRECRQIQYQRSDILAINYKTDHSGDFQKMKITKNIRNSALTELPKVEKTIFNIKLSKEKKKDLQAMLPYMCNIQDQRFYENVIKTH